MTQKPFDPVQALERSTLDNGLRILTAAMPHTRSVTLGIYVGAGSRYERDAEAGLSHFLEHMLFKGTEHFPTAREISQTIESAGGSHNAATDREATVYWAKVPHTVTGEVLDILCDMVRAPLLESAELEKERHVILEELAMIEDSPADLASVLIDEVMWPDQPLGREIGGTAESVTDLSLEAVQQYFRRQYEPGNLVVVATGHLQHDAIVQGIDRWLAPMQPGTPSAWFPVIESPTTPRVRLRNKPTEQAHFCLAYPGFPNGHDDQYTMDLISAMLGDGMSSRLFLDLREERALVYDVHSYSSEYRDTGTVNVYAGCDPDSTRETIEATYDVISTFARDVTDAELAMARRMLTGRLQLRMEDTRTVAGWLGSQELLLNEVSTVDEAIARIEAVTLDDIRRVTASHLDPAHARLAVVGPYDDDSTFQGLVP